MFRFTIRDVLWLTVLAAVTVTWWVDRRSVASSLDKLAEYQLAEQAEKEWLAAQEANKDKLLKYLRERHLNGPSRVSPKVPLQE